VWSADARRLACEGFGQTDPSRNGIYTVRSSDGQDLRQVTRNPGGDDIPGSYSPNNHRIVFVRFDPTGLPVGLFTVRTNGTGLRRLTPTGALVSSPGDWSLGGNRIVFNLHVTPDVHSTIWVIRANGRGLHQIRIHGLFCGGPNNNPAAVGCKNPQWSPDGRKILFVSNEKELAYTVNANGTNLHRVTRADDWVDWGTHPLIR
jgi:Tol biopolymer transport system component